mmetsp:Transcript_29527/g.94345  ORF Transcript_29527/g.94345 Transcript_29527/m.94345 type:complete len:343 (+) Transcript_29527:24-1052(+)
MSSLTPEEEAAGVKLADPACGYKYVEEADGDHPLACAGLVHPFDFVLPAVYELREKLAPKPHDVFIATYPKCGTTWMQQIVMLLLRGGSADVNPMADAPWLEMSVSRAAKGSAAMKSLSSTPPRDCAALCALSAPEGDSGRRAWKTHATAEAAPWRGGPAAAAAAGSKVVVVCRNPKDAAVSMLHHTKNIPGFGFSGGWDDFVALFLRGKVESSSIWPWHRGWWEAAAAHPSTVLVVHFEDLKRDLKAAVGRVAAHLGLERSDAELEAVAARSSFEVMKAEAAARDAETLKKGGSIKKDHFREGKTGGWRELMSPELQREFDEKTAALEAAAAAGGHAFRAV